VGPVPGRVDYQCFNFYLQLIGDDKITNNCDAPWADPAVVRVLEREAFDFVTFCISALDGEGNKIEVI
jgi:hypothetical protein